jgi:hypothetical protein
MTDLVDEEVDDVPAKVVHSAYGVSGLPMTRAPVYIGGSVWPLSRFDTTRGLW